MFHSRGLQRDTHFVSFTRQSECPFVGSSLCGFALWVRCVSDIRAIFFFCLRYAQVTNVMPPQHCLKKYATWGSFLLLSASLQRRQIGHLVCTVATGYLSGQVVGGSAGAFRKPAQSAVLSPCQRPDEIGSRKHIEQSTNRFSNWLNACTSLPREICMTNAKSSGLTTF